MTEYAHHWRIKEDARYLRFYCWLWEADPDRADFCKLFWGYVFVLPGLFMRGAFAVFIGMGERIAAFADWIIARKRRKIPNAEADMLAFLERIERGEAEPKQKRMQKILSAIAVTAAKLMPVLAILGRVLLFLLGMLAVAAMVALGFVIVIFWDIAWKVLAGIGAAAILALILYSFIYLLIRSEAVEKTAGWIDAREPVKFGRAIKQGFISVKANTCPKVEIISSKK